MKKNVFPGALVLCAFTSAKEGPWFSGKIVRHNTFKTLAGEDISAKLTPILGATTRTISAITTTRCTPKRTSW